MTDINKPKRLRHSTPASYRIEVEGRLAKNWSSRLAGMTITCRKRSDQTTVTRLTGRLTNQSMLQGVLNTLEAMHLPILNVQSLDQDQDNGQAIED